MPSAVVLALDGLGAKHLGPYGNTWIETPAFNRLAAESLLIDGLYAPTTNRTKTYDAWWHHDDANLIGLLNKHGIHTHLLTDEAEIFDYPSASQFAQQDKIESAHGLRLALEWDETHTARFFAQAIQAIEATPKNSLLWLHCRGLHNPWDAPYLYRQQFVDDEDPDPSGSAQVPSLTLDVGYDPDTLHEIQCAFAGQVVLIDQCLAVLQAVIRDVAEQSEMLFMVSATGGFPLGEHLQVGLRDKNLLYHESLSLPAWVRYPRGEMAMKRRGEIVEFGDLAACLHEWLLHGNATIQWSPRQFSICQSSGCYLLRTPAWHIRFTRLTEDREQDLQAAELYVKPDDQNEVNDVSDRCEAVVEAGREFLIARLNDSSTAAALPEILLETSG